MCSCVSLCNLFCLDKIPGPAATASPCAGTAPGFRVSGPRNAAAVLYSQPTRSHIQNSLNFFTSRMGPSKKSQRRAKAPLPCTSILITTIDDDVLILLTLVRSRTTRSKGRVSVTHVIHASHSRFVSSFDSCILHSL